jgi:hypothetical protein
MNRIPILSLILLLSCCKEDDPAVATKYDSLIGSWRLEKNEVVIAFEIVADPANPNSGILYTTEEAVTYIGKTAYPSQTGSPLNKIIKENGFYTIDFFTVINKNANRTRLYACEPNNDKTTLTAVEGTRQDLDGSYVALGGFDDSNPPTIISFRSPIVVTRVNEND